MTSFIVTAIEISHDQTKGPKNLITLNNPVRR